MIGTRRAEPGLVTVSRELTVRFYLTICAVTLAVIVDSAGVEVCPTLSWLAPAERSVFARE